MEPLSGEIMREVFSASPRQLSEISAELLFLNGEQYLFHYKQGNADKYKFVSPTSVRAAFSHTPIDSGWLKPGIQRWGTGPKGDWVVLFIPPQKHQIDLSELGKIIVPLPALVFAGIKQDYRVWAINSKEFSPDAIALNAPLPNVNPHSSFICWGALKPPLAGTQTIHTAWEMFINSPFTSHWADGKSLRKPEDVRKTLLTISSRKYPASDLVLFETNSYAPRHTIAQLIDNLLN
jgi:hypothetical protein